MAVSRLFNPEKMRYGLLLRAQVPGPANRQAAGRKIALSAGAQERLIFFQFFLFAQEFLIFFLREEVVEFLAGRNFDFKQPTFR